MTAGPDLVLPFGDRRLLRVVDDALAEARTRSGAFLACRPGCASCCIGPFPITALDAARLAAGMAELERTAPQKARAVRERARAAVARLAAAFPGCAASGVLDANDDAEERFCEAFADEPCPALDPDSRTCDLYEWRPVSCRTFGPAITIDGDELPPCDLCFAGATPAQVASARVRIEIAALEQALLDRLQPSAAGDTIVAFALAKMGSGVIFER